MTDTLLTAREAAIVLKVHPNTIKRMIKRGELQAHRIGDRGDIRISLAQIDAFLERSET